MSPVTRSHTTKKQKFDPTKTLSTAASENLKKIQARVLGRKPSSNKTKGNNMVSDPNNPDNQNEDVEPMDEDLQDTNNGPQSSSSKISSLHEKPTTAPHDKDAEVAPTSGTNENTVPNKENLNTNQNTEKPEQIYEKITRRTPYRVATQDPAYY